MSIVFIQYASEFILLTAYLSRRLQRSQDTTRAEFSTVFYLIFKELVKDFLLFLTTPLIYAFILILSF